MKYHNYIFFTPKDVIPSNAPTDEFINTITAEKKVLTYSYTTLGLKADTAIMLWLQSNELETMQNLLKNLLHTPLGKNLRISYTLLGMTRPTQYYPASVKHEDTSRKGGKYLIIYPFTKTHAWYMLDFEQRRELMKGHIAIGKKYPQINQLLLYSYGIDDQEFIVSYETDSLADFQQLVMELRSDAVRAYTQKDTPIFTAIYRPMEETLSFL